MAFSGAKMAAVFVIVIIFVLHAYADDQCTAGCYGASHPKDGFVQGNTYTYWLEGVASIRLSGADKQETSVQLSAQATVVALGNCANLLKVISLQITGNDGTKYNKPQDMEKPVRFTLQDGVLGSNICAEAGDSKKSLNIKRAILSLLQTATKHNTEVDVFGICRTRFIVSEDGATVRKNRDLNSCAHRQQGKQDLMSYIYNPNPEIKTSHLLQADMRADVVLKDGIVEMVEAQEDYLYRPFSAGQAGARGAVTTKLLLKETSKGTLSSTCVVPRSIIFENPRTVKTDSSSMENLLLALNSATQALDGHVQDKSAAIFANLIKVFRVSSKENMMEVYRLIKDESVTDDTNLAKKVFLDALFRAGTGDSVEVSIALLQEKELTPLQQKLVLLSLTTARHASSESLKAATLLLDGADASNELLLGIGALAGAYCREHPCHGPGSRDAGVAAVFAKLTSKLGDCKSGSKKAEDMIISALKSLKNIHHLEDSVVDRLARCAADTSVNQRVRVAALETFSADACIPKLKSTALDILKDTQHDSELRIKAYLALLQCPCANVAGELKTLLDSEPVNQVGSYITSSLRNIRASTNPAREAAKQYFSAIPISNKFSLDLRKYSQNYEVSYEIESLGIGSVVEGDVIYSQNSFLPRSANLNLTAEIFGQQVNLIELGVRQGNLDSIFEIFGPHGFFKSHHLFKDPLFQRTSSSPSPDNPRQTHPAETEEDVEKLINTFGNRLKTDMKGYRGYLDLDVIVKLFGTESVYLSLGDGDHSASLDSLIDRFFDFAIGGIPESKRFSHEVRNHMLFLDTELAYPTFSGMDLKLTLEGAATSKLQFGGHFDTKKIIENPRDAKFEVVVTPSANIEISGTLSIDADVVVHGLKVVAALHTSTGSHLQFKIVNEELDLLFGLPTEKQEIVTATSEIFFYKREKGHRDVETKVIFDNGSWKQHKGCLDQLSKAVGLALCGELSVPRNDLSNHVKGTPSAGPLFPLNGHYKLAVSLEKDDFNRFHAHAGVSLTQTGEVQLVLNLEVEGNIKKDRKASFLIGLVGNRDVTHLRAVLDSPHKYLSAKAAMIHSQHEQSISADFKVDKNDYHYKVGLQTLDETTSKPLLEYTLPDKSEPISVDGTITARNKKYILNNVCLVTKNDRITLNGYISVVTGLDTDLKLTFGNHTASLRATLKVIVDVLNVDLEFHNTFNPSADFLLVYKNHINHDSKTYDVLFIHGPEPKFDNGKNNLHFFTGIHGDMRHLTEYDVVTTFSYSTLAISFDGKLGFHPTKYDLELNGGYQDSKAEFELEFRNAMKREIDLFGKILMKVNGKGFKVKSKYDAVSDDKGFFTNKLEIYPGDTYELAGTVTHKLAAGHLDLGLDAKFKSSGKPENCDISLGVVHNFDTYNSHLKLSRGSTNYVDALFNIGYEPTRSGTLKFIVKDVINAQGQYKVNPDHKGDGFLVIELTKTHRKVKWETTFMIADPQYDITIDIFPNHGMDDAQKITFTTSTKNTDDSFDSKNSLTINGDTTDVHIKREGFGVLNDGKYNTVLDISRPDKIDFFFYWQNMGVTKGDDRKASIQLNFGWGSETKSDLIKVMISEYLINMNKNTGQDEEKYSLFIVTKHSEFLDLKLNVKTVPKNQRKNVDVTIELTSSIIPEKIVYTSNVDYSDGESDEQCDARYQLKGLYGKKASVDVTGSYSKTAPKNADKTFDNDMTISMILPLDKALDVKLSSVDHVVIPHLEDKYIEFTSKKSLQVNADTYKYEAALQLAERDGKVKISALIPKQETLTLESSYSCQEAEDNTRKFNSVFNVDRGAEKHLHLVLEGTRKEKEGDVTITVVLPDNLKTKQIVTCIKYNNPGSRSFSSDVNVDVDGKKYILTSEVDLWQKDSSVIDIKATCPEARPVRVYFKVQKSGEHKYNGVSKLEHLGDFNMDMTIDAKLVAPEDFDIKMDVDSAKLKLNKVHFTAKSEATDKDTNKIEFSARENGKDVLTGLTTFQSRREGDTVIVEGSGSIKVKGEQEATSFKYIKSVAKEKNRVEVFLNLVLGEKNLVVEHEASNQKYKLSSVYCEGKNQCAKMYIDNKLDTSVPHRLSQKLELGFDLRTLGFTPRFGLETSTKLERFKLPVHLLDIHFSQDKSMYHAHVFAKPVKGVYQTALTLTTPHRIISLESATSVPDGQSKNPFPITHETVFFLNKKDPGSRTQLKIVTDFQRTEQKQVSTSGEVFFSCPSLGKDFQITGNAQYDATSHIATSELVLDIFKKKAQKVVVTFELHPELVRTNDVFKTQFSYEMEGRINGKELGFDVLLEEKFFLSSQQVKLSSVAALTLDGQRKACSLLLDATPSKQTFVLTAPDVEVLRMEGACSRNVDVVNVDLTICALEERTYHTSGEVSYKSPFSVTLVAERKGYPAKVVLSGKAEPKMIEMKAEHFDGKQLLPLASFSLNTHNREKPTFHVDRQQTSLVAEKAYTELTELGDIGDKFLEHQIMQTVEDFQKLEQTFQSASADFSGLLTSNQQELRKISEELESDKALMQLRDNVQTSFRSVKKVATEIAGNLVEIFMQTFAVFADFLDDLLQIWIDQLLPGLTSLSKTVADLTIKMVDAVSFVIGYGSMYLTGFVEKNIPSLIPVFESIAENLQEYCSEGLGMIGGFFQDFNSIGDLSIVQTLKDMFEQNGVTNIVQSIVDDVLQRCSGLSPTEELQAFFDALIAYVDKASNTNKLNELEEWIVIYSKFFAAVDSLATYFCGIIGVNISHFVSGGFNTISLPLNFVITSYPLGETNIDTKQILKSFWPKSLNPLDMLPPDELRGMVAGGQHIFTFDGRHMTFPGDCRYILAQDAVDGNFSIIMNVEKGIAKSVTLWDKSKNAIEVNDKIQLTLNGQKRGFQVFEDDTAAWKDGQTFIIKSRYGASITCSFNLDLCYVQVSGFYLGRLRGLLGDGNNEPFDDFRLPSGQICTSESEFGNSYALTPDCRQVKTVDHSDHRGHHGNEAGGVCSKLFGEKSTLKVCEVFVGIKNFRQACQHATTSGGLGAVEDACLIAKAYTLACHASGISVTLPAECAACQVDGATYRQGQVFNVTTPQKQADIVIAVETTKDNKKTFEELVLPLMSSVINELKTKDIDDVKVHLVGISPKMGYPIYYDTENPELKDSKMDFNDELQYYNWESPTSLNEEFDGFVNRIFDHLQVVAVEFGVDNLHLSYSALIKDMEWRPEAVKSIIMVNSHRCSTAAVPAFQYLGQSISHGLMKDEGVVAHLISPVTAFRNTASVVGFNNNLVFVLANETNGWVYEKLKDAHRYFRNDQCVSYAEKTFGNVFSSKNFLALNADRQKDFIQFASHILVDSLAAVNVESKCKCGMGSLTSTVRCSVQTSQEEY